MMPNLGDMSLGALLGYIHHTYGRDGLKQTFDGMLTLASSYFTYEFIERAIPELNEVGLHTVAKDVEELMKDLPHKWQLPCPDMPPHDGPWKERTAKLKAEWEAKNSLKKAS
jgi:hypothetical protein